MQLPALSAGRIDQTEELVCRFDYFCGVKPWRYIPNTLTLCNLLCGCLAISRVLGPDYDLFYASLFVVGGAIFDFLDGFSARLLRVASSIGKELDSLADVITFGLVPALIAQRLLLETEFFPGTSILLYFPLLIVLFSALRLAIFNVDSRQVTGFIGMPTPANALLWISFPLVHSTTATDHLPWWMSPFLTNGWAVLALSLLSSFLLVSKIPMMALKFRRFGWRGNRAKYLLVGSSIFLFSLFQFAAIPIILLLYIILSFFVRPITHEI